MDNTDFTSAPQVADTIVLFDEQTTRNAPTAVVISEATLVITLHGGLSHAEMKLANSAASAARGQDFHRHLVANSLASSR